MHPVLKEDEQPIIRSATTYVIEGEVTDRELAAIKKHCINPVDSRETGLEKAGDPGDGFPGAGRCEIL